MADTPELYGFDRTMLFRESESVEKFPTGVGNFYPMKNKSESSKK